MICHPRVRNLAVPYIITIADSSRRPYVQRRVLIVMAAKTESATADAGKARQSATARRVPQHYQSSSVRYRSNIDIEPTRRPIE